MSKSGLWRGTTGFGCLVLFAIPFFGVGIAATWWSIRLVQQFTEMQTWVETPATIKKAELKSHSGKSDTYKAIAVYDYTFGGKQFTGERVAIDSGSDNIGGFQRRAYENLKQHQNTGQPFRCYVNPAKPSDAVLFRNLRGEMLVFYTLFATLFGSVGLLLITGSIAAWLGSPKARAEEPPADQPWLANPQWATGQIRESAGATVSVPILAAIGVYWNIAAAPLYSALRDVFAEDTSGWRWISLVFIAIGIGLVIAFFHQFFSLRKFGRSVLQLASTPGVIGGQLAGVIQIPRPLDAPDGFRLKLSCVQTTGSGKNKHEHVRWQAERIVTQPMNDGGGTTAVPVLFAIPFDCPDSSPPDGSGRIAWQLEASARMPGVDYRAKFDVPVFKTPDSRADFKLDEQLAADFTSAPSREALFREARITTEPLASGGVRINFPAARRNLGSATAMLVVLVLWSGAIWLMLRHNAFLLFPIVFALFELLFLWIVLDLWLYSSTVEASQNGLVGRGGWLGMGRTWSFAPDEIRTFTGEQNMSSGTSVWYDVAVVPRSGKKQIIAKRINSKLVQEALIDELNKALERDESAD